jgi:uncharacterized protein YjiS (DUF1127 family)
MTQRTIYTIDDISRILDKSRAEHSRAVAEMVAKAPRALVRLAKLAVGRAARQLELARVARELRAMDARMLADIGLTQGEIELVASGKLTRGSLRPVLRAANESVAPAERASPKAA